MVITVKDNKFLILIPKCEIYLEYMINVLNKLPKVEKFSIGNNFKNIMYEMIGNSKSKRNRTFNLSSKL